MKLRPNFLSTKDKLRRAGWILLVVLFLVTGLGVGIYSFLTNMNGSSSPTSNYIQCAKGAKEPNQQPVNGKVRGAKLADFTSLKNKHIDYLSCTDYKVGTGAQITASNQTVTVKYVGALASTGEIFDDSFDNGQAFSTQLTQVITGWSNGLMGMKVGGMRRVFIPAQYAYGSQSVSNIPANSDLVFDVQLTAVK